MSKILIQDFICECKKICDDASWRIDEFLNKRYQRNLTKYIKVDDALLIADTFISETQASELDIKSFRMGLHRLIDGERIKPRYDDGIPYVTAQYIQRY